MRKPFSDREKLKARMKQWLPLIFTVAWSPVIWMVLTILLGSWMHYVIGVWWVVLVILSVSTLLVMTALFRIFRSFSLQIFDEKNF
jgi:hypothetical protein